MKKLATTLFTIFAFQTCFSQVVDTVRVYDCLALGSSWILKIRGNHTFTLYTNSLFSKDEIISVGKWETGDTTIQFQCRYPGRNYNEQDKVKANYFAGFPFVFCGNNYKWQNHIIIPQVARYRPEDSVIIPAGMYTEYYRGNGFWSNIIELKQDGTYSFIDQSCTARSGETGTWTHQNGILTFRCNNPGRSMLERVTDNGVLYLTDNHLVGRKLVKTVTPSKKTTVTETFIYLAKVPIFSED